MAKTNLKSLKVCKQCEQSKAAVMPMTRTTGLVNKKTVTGSVCTGYVGKMICGWKEVNKA